MSKIPISVLEVPCASLKLYNNDGISRKILESLSEYRCQRTFLDWVTDDRPGYLGIEENELKMCPMIWCRKTFDTIDSAIHHVFGCPRLSNAWYWCPYHRRPERFLERNKRCELSRTTKMYHVARFFIFFCYRRFLKRKADRRREIFKVTLEKDTLNSARQEMIPEQELDTGTDRQMFELLRSDLLLSAGNSSAIMAGRVNPEASSLNCQSRILELCGDEIFELGEPPPQEMYDPSTSGNVMPMSVSLGRRNSPELLHPINREPDRDSLWQRRRGMPAANDRWRGYCSRIDVTEDTTSRPSSRPSKPNDSHHSVPGDGDNIPTGNTSNDPHQSIETYVHPMSHEISPDDVVLTTSSPLTGVIIPSSPNQLFASLPAYMAPPTSPPAEYMHPALIIASSATMDHDDPSLRTAEQQDENAGGRTTPISTHSQSMPEKPNDTLSVSDSLDSIFNLYRRSSSATSLRRL